MIQREEFEAWLTHPMTKEVCRVFKEKRMEIAESWADGNKLEPELQVYAHVYGVFANLSYEDIQEEEEDHEQESN